MAASSSSQRKQDDLFQWVNQNPTEAAEGPNVVIRFMRTRCTQELITRGWTVAELAARTGRTTDEIADLSRSAMG